MKEVDGNPGCKHSENSVGAAVNSLVTLIVEILLQILDALFLGLPEAVRSLLKTWSIFPSWKLLGLAAGSGTRPCLALNAGGEVCCALGTTGFLKSCGSTNLATLFFWI